MARVKPRPLMPCGVDIGVSGGFGAVDVDELVLAARVRGADAMMQELEGSHKKLTAKDKKKPRYINMALRPKSTRLFDSLETTLLLNRANELARERGYSGIYVVVEAPQTHIGKSHPASYLTTGGCFHSWVYSLESTRTRWGVVPPSHWKAGMKLSSNKEQSIVCLSQRLPSTIARRLEGETKLVLEEHNVCEAILLALWLKEFCPQYLDLNYANHR